MTVRIVEDLIREDGVVVLAYNEKGEPEYGKFDGTTTIDQIWRWAVRVAKGIPGEIKAYPGEIMLYLDKAPKDPSTPTEGREQ